MEKNPQDPHLLTLINLTAIAVRRMIKMVKKINAFKNLCQEDQVALLKGGCTEMMILRSMMQYDVDHSIWTIPQSQEMMSSIKGDILKLASNNVYEEYDQFIRTFDVRLRKDENIILILSAIILFTPSQTKIVHSDVVSLEQVSRMQFIPALDSMTEIISRTPTTIYCVAISRACTLAVKRSRCS